VTEALRAEGEWAQRGIERRGAEADLAVARRVLALQWGASEATYDTLALAAPDAGDVTPDLAAALAAQPELRQATSESAVAAARLRAARAARIPELTALGGVRHFAEDNTTGFIANLSAPLPLWNRGGAAVAAAEAEQRAAAAHLTITRLQLEQQLAEAQQRRSAARESYELARTHAWPAAERALAQLEDGYRRGRFTYLDYLDGQRSALDIQLALLEAERDYWRARLTIERISGAPLPPEEVR
jgi:cobalt-zinc-cadmium efflux system outer membrane protein